MSSAKGPQYHDIPIVIDGKAKILKSVTKFTTCDDVINKLPKTGAPLAVFQTANGEVKELKGKTNLLKIWRSHGSSKKSVFVVKQSEGGKTRRLSLNIFGGRNSRKSLEPESKDKLKQVSDLAFYLQYQKSKLQKMANSKESSDVRNMQKVKSTSSMDNMDAFLVKADHQKMGQFLNFCSDVTSRHLGGTPKLKQSETETPRTRLDRAIIKDSLKNTRLGFKKTLTSKLSFVSKTTSASTLKSTDTGYQSKASDMRRRASAKPQLPTTALLQDTDGMPRHSTPVTCSSKRGIKREIADETLDVTLTTPKILRFDENEGKSVLMERFMNDTTICESRKRGQHRASNQKVLRNMYTSEPVLFRSQEEKCRFYWNQSCDSDSDSSCCDDDSCISAQDLDEAFVEYCNDVDTFDDLSEPTPRKLRRESALSNLNRFEVCAKPFEDTCYDIEPVNSGFNYSFNCAFPEFSDTQDFSIDYSCSETESDLSSSFEEDYFRGVKDSDFYSFMKSRESLASHEKSRYFARDCEEKQSEVGSDEGLGSMASDSFSDDQEVF